MQKTYKTSPHTAHSTPCTINDKIYSTYYILYAVAHCWLMLLCFSFTMYIKYPCWMREKSKYREARCERASEKERHKIKDREREKEPHGGSWPDLNCVGRSNNVLHVRLVVTMELLLYFLFFLLLLFFFHNEQLDLRFSSFSFPLFENDRFPELVNKHVQLSLFFRPIPKWLKLFTYMLFILHISVMFEQRTEKKKAIEGNSHSYWETTTNKIK